MNKNSIIPILRMAFVMAFLAIAAATPRASAQCCTTFQVGGTHLPPHCYPVVVSITWNNGHTQTVVVPGPGMQTYPVPAPCPAFILSASVSPGPCCVTTQIARDPVTGCFQVYLQHC